jgi:hypothetical protein
MAMQTSDSRDCTWGDTVPCAVRSVISPIGEDTDGAEWKRPFTFSNKLIRGKFQWSVDVKEQFGQRMIPLTECKDTTSESLCQDPEPSEGS